MKNDLEPLNVIPSSGKKNYYIDSESHPGQIIKLEEYRNNFYIFMQKINITNKVEKCRQTSNFCTTMFKDRTQWNLFQNFGSNSLSHEIEEGVHR